MESKWIAKSLTLWGALITAFSALAPVLGIDLTPEALADINTGGVEIINAIGVIVGSLMTIIGRLRAGTKATLLPKPPVGHVMKASGFATVAAIALLGISAGACSSMFPQMSPIMGAAPGAPAGAEDAGGETSLLDRMADDIVAAGTPEQRALRVCLFSTVAAEVYVYRLLNYGGEAGELEGAYGTVARMAQSVKTLRAQQATLWFEAEMFYAAAGIVRAVEGPVRDRALGAIGRVITQDWRGIARGLRTSAAQAALAGAMFRDARNAAEAIGSGAVTMEEAWDACQGRLDAKLAQLAGAIGIEAPPLLRVVPGA